VAESDAAGFDAELYLRLTGERTLLDRGGNDGRPWDSPLAEAARALVAVGMMTADTAQAVLEDYLLALSYREDQHHRHHLMAWRATRSPAAPHPGLAALRTVPCGRMIEQPWGQLVIKYVVLGGEVTTLHVTMRPAPPPPTGQPARQAAGQPVRRPARAAIMSARAGRARGPGGGTGLGGHTVGPGLPGLLALTDDRGTTMNAGFSGSGDGTDWTGSFEADPPLARDTAWIEVLGERVELASEPGAGAEVWVEPLAEQDPARRYLWARLASVTGQHTPNAIEATIDTLVAAGALAPDDPVIGQAQAVLARISHSPGGPGSHAPLPEPWQSLLAGRSRGGGPAGPTGLAVVGAVTPPFEGITVAVLAVQSTEDEFSLDVEVTPGVAHWHAFRGPVEEPILAWWAADDRGHHYLGQQGSWQASEDRSGGQIEFTPALDPAASTLDIMPTGTSSRAVIRVPLAWDEAMQDEAMQGEEG
jgi:hypothetical protein